MKGYLIIIGLCLASGNLQAYDSSYTEPLFESIDFKSCTSNDNALVTEISSTPNPFFCFQNSEFYINTTIVSGTPIVLNVYIMEPDFINPKKIPENVGQNQTEGGYNEWEFSHFGDGCQPGLYNLTIVITDSVTGEIAACEFIEYEIPSPSGNVGKIGTLGNDDFNIYTVDVSPVPDTCKAETIIVTGALVTSTALPNVNKTTLTINNGVNPEIYEFEINDFNNGALSINTYNMTIPAPSTCISGRLYTATIKLIDGNNGLVQASWVYDYTPDNPPTKSNKGKSCDSNNGFSLRNIEINPENITHCTPVTIEINGTLFDHDDLHLNQVNLTLTYHGVSLQAISTYKDINTTMASFNTYSIVLNPPRKCTYGSEYSYQIEIIDVNTQLSQACWTVDFKVPDKKESGSLFYFVNLAYLVISLII